MRQQIGDWTSRPRWPVEPRKREGHVAGHPSPGTSALPSRLLLSHQIHDAMRVAARDCTSAHSRSSSLLGFSPRHLPLGHSHRSPKSSAPHPMPPLVLRLFAAAPPRAGGGRAGALRSDGRCTRLRLRVRAATGEAAPPPSRTQVSRARCCSPPFTAPYGLLFVRGIVSETRRGCPDLCVQIGGHGVRLLQL